MPAAVVSAVNPVDFVLGPIEGLLGLLTLGLLVLKLFALVDAAVRPEPVWRAAGTSSKTLWLVLLVVAVLFNGLGGILAIAGLVAAIVYLVDVRPKLREVRGGGRPGGGRWR